MLDTGKLRTRILALGDNDKANEDLSDPEERYSLVSGADRRFDPDGWDKVAPALNNCCTEKASEVSWAISTFLLTKEDFVCNKEVACDVVLVFCIDVLLLILLTVGVLIVFNEVLKRFDDTNWSLTLSVLVCKIKAFVATTGSVFSPLKRGVPKKLKDG